MPPDLSDTLGCPSGPRSVGRAVTGVHSRTAPPPTFLSLRGARQGPPQGLEGPRAEEQPCWAPPWTQRVCRVWRAPAEARPTGEGQPLAPHHPPRLWAEGLRADVCTGPGGRSPRRSLVLGGGWRGPLTSRTSGGGGLWQRWTWAVRGEACGRAGWGDRDEVGEQFHP